MPVLALLKGQNKSRTCLQCHGLLVVNRNTVNKGSWVELNCNQCDQIALDDTFSVTPSLL